jgi:hypothetical protein
MKMANGIKKNWAPLYGGGWDLEEKVGKKVLREWKETRPLGGMKSHDNIACTCPVMHLFQCIVHHTFLLSTCSEACTKINTVYRVAN